MRLACSRRADSSFLVAGSLPMAEGSLRAAPKSLFRNTYRSTALNHTTSLWVWNFPQSNLGDKTQTRHTAGPMEKKPQRERIAFRRPDPNSRASPAAPLASRRQPSKFASPVPATRPSPSASAPPAPARVFRQDYVSVKSKTSFTKRSATFQNTAKVPAEAPSPASSRRASARASSCSSPFRTSPASHGGLSGPSWPSPYRRR